MVTGPTDQYLVDTQTGRVWRQVCVKSDEKLPCETLVEMPIMNRHTGKGGGGPAKAQQ
jgi:hypothetical protein